MPLWCKSAYQYIYVHICTTTCNMSVYIFSGLIGFWSNYSADTFWPTQRWSMLTYLFLRSKNCQPYICWVFLSPFAFKSGAPLTPDLLLQVLRREITFAAFESLKDEKWQAPVRLIHLFAYLCSAALILIVHIKQAFMQYTTCIIFNVFFLWICGRSYQTMSSSTIMNM